MEINLYRVRSGWAIKVATQVEVFLDIESAADVLLNLGVKDDAIDLAIIELYGAGHFRANFGVNGGFIFSDEARLDEQFGLA